MKLAALISLGLLALLLPGCGYVGDPRPPSLGIPLPATAFSAHQVGDRIIGDFVMPDMTTDDARLRSVDAFVRIVREIPVAAVPGKPAHFSIDSKEWTGQSVKIAARLRGPSGRWSEWSNEISLKVEAPVPKPVTFTAELTAKGVELRWTPPSAASISRRVAGDAEFAALHDAPASPSLDATAEYGKRYEYRMQARTGDALSEPSTVVAIAVEDHFPPSVPTGLDAVPGLTSIELSWDLAPESDTDFAGWNIYRAASGAEFVKIAGPIQLPSYSDPTARPAVAYRYAVTSIDKTGNESARSMPVDALLPPE